MSKFKIEDGIKPLTISKLLGRKKSDNTYPLERMQVGQSILLASDVKAHMVKKRYQQAHSKLRRERNQRGVPGKFQVAFDEQSNLRIFKLA